MADTAFCFTCRKKMPYTVSTSWKTIGVHGEAVVFSYREKTAHCAECGDEVYVPSVSDANAQAREDAFRHAVEAFPKNQKDS